MKTLPVTADSFMQKNWRTDNTKLVASFFRSFWSNLIMHTTVTFVNIRLFRLHPRIWRHTFFAFVATAPQCTLTSSFMRFLDHTQRRTTVSRTPLDEWSVRRTELYLTTHNTHNRQTSMSPVGFETTMSAGERPQTHALDRAANGLAYFTGIFFSITNLSSGYRYHAKGHKFNFTSV
jgi:hypothetical protein